MNPISFNPYGASYSYSNKNKNKSPHSSQAQKPIDPHFGMSGRAASGHHRLLSDASKNILDNNIPLVNANNGQLFPIEVTTASLNLGRQNSALRGNYLMENADGYTWQAVQTDLRDRRNIHIPDPLSFEEQQQQQLSQMLSHEHPHGGGAEYAQPPGSPSLYATDLQNRFASQHPGSIDGWINQQEPLLSQETLMRVPYGGYSDYRNPFQHSETNTVGSDTWNNLSEGWELALPKLGEWRSDESSSGLARDLEALDLEDIQRYSKEKHGNFFVLPPASPHSGVQTGANPAVPRATVHKDKTAYAIAYGKHMKTNPGDQKGAKQAADRARQKAARAALKQQQQQNPGERSAYSIAYEEHILSNPGDQKGANQAGSRERYRNRKKPEAIKQQQQNPGERSAYSIAYGKHMKTNPGDQKGAKQAAERARQKVARVALKQQQQQGCHKNLFRNDDPDNDRGGLGGLNYVDPGQTTGPS